MLSEKIIREKLAELEKECEVYRNRSWHAGTKQIRLKIEQLNWVLEIPEENVINL